jgi:hypothetical protein
MEGATNSKTANHLGLSGCKHTRENAPDSQGWRLSAEAIRVPGNTAWRTQQFVYREARRKIHSKCFGDVLTKKQQNETKKEKKLQKMNK